MVSNNKSKSVKFNDYNLYDFMVDPNLVTKAKQEFVETNKVEQYKSPFPDDHKPPFHRLTDDQVQYPNIF